MANINRSRTADVAPVSEDDPFAELSRIMGHDPVAQFSRSVQASSDERLALDLENELLGSLSLYEEDYEEVRSSHPVNQNDTTLAMAAPAGQGDAFGSADPLDAGFDAAFDGGWEAPEAEVGSRAEITAQEADTVATAPAPDRDFDSNIRLFDRIAAELRDPRREAREPAGASSADEDLSTFQAEWQELAPAASAKETADPSVFSNFSEMRSGEPVMPVATASSPTDDAPSAFRAEWEELAPAASDDVPSETAPYFTGFSAYPASRAVESTPVEAPASQDEHFADVALDETPEAAVNAADGREDNALEAELEASLEAEDLGLDDLDGFAAIEPAVEAEPREDPAFDYSRASLDRHDYLDDSQDFALAGLVDELVLDDPTMEQADGVPTSDPLAEAAMEPAAPASGGFRSVFGGSLSAMPFWRAGRETTEAAGRENAQAGASNALTTEELTAKAIARSGNADLPEIETTDIADRVAAVEDDLDIPEPELPPEPVAEGGFGDLEAELAGAFGEITDEALAEPTQVKPLQGAGIYQQTPATAAMQPEATAPVAVFSNERFELETAYAPTEFDRAFDETGKDDYSAWAAGFEEEQVEQDEGPRSRFGLPWKVSLVGTAAIAAMVLLGGASLYALTSGGAGLGQPAVVKAGDEPFKIRPKNPGGTKVADDNNEVYQRASGAAMQPPAQKALLTTAEEPLDLSQQMQQLSQQAQPRIVDASAVGNTENGGDSAGIAEGGAKSEARLAPADSVEGQQAPEAISVQAHRVKTYVVKPDGTLVPREAPAPQIASTSPSDSAAQPRSATAPSSEANSAPAAMTSKPESVSSAVGRAGTETPKPSATRPAQQPEPQKQQNTVASAEPAPKAPIATTASEGWSVQIASQPSAEAAQQSYEAIARRYGEVLSGRGVNIVKADISGKGTYYRVRIPSSSKDDAVGLCTKLKSAGGSCFVSK